MALLIDQSSPDSYLAWPRDVFLDELTRQINIINRGGHNARRWPETMSRLLRSAFQGPALADEFDSLGGYLDGGYTPEQTAWVAQLRSEAGTAPPAPPVRPYWSQRAGAKPEKLTQATAMDRFVSLVEHLDRDDSLWAGAFGVDCPDGVGDPIEAPSVQIEQLLGKKIGSGAWPLGHSRALWSLDDFFDLIEVLHDLASWPGTWGSHNFGGCPGHPGDFSPGCGQALYRYQVNLLLDQSTLGVRIADAGEDRGRIVHVAAPDLEEVVDKVLDKPPSGFEDDVTHAVALFRSRGRDVASMRSAVVALAGVLERNRALLKEELLSRDEAAFFDIANNFDLRHRKADQRTDYDLMFLEWLFYWYLATVKLVADLQTRQDGTSLAGDATAGGDGAPEPF